MAQFKYGNEIAGLMNIDGPITKGPVPRWQRKGQANSSSVNNSILSLSTSMNTTTTVTKSPSKKNDSRSKKTPINTPLKNKSPGRSGGATPSQPKTPGGGDRFIPSRSATNFDLVHYKINQTDSNDGSPSKTDMQQALMDNIPGGGDTKKRILAFQKKAPPAPEGFQNPMKILYSQTKTPSSVKCTNRYIPQAPDRILDAPDIIDDYYLNLIDWNSNNILAAALGEHVYLWDAGKQNEDLLIIIY